jgi:hypothetical protein
LFYVQFCDIIIFNIDICAGFTGFDYDLAWRAMLKDATVPPDDDLTTMYFDRQVGYLCQ